MAITFIHSWYIVTLLIVEQTALGEAVALANTKALYPASKSLAIPCVPLVGHMESQGFCWLEWFGAD